MPQHVIRIDADGQPHYLVWSTIVDAPTAGPGTREQMRAHLVGEYGTRQESAIDGMLARADANGTSERGETSVEGTIAGNRAGLNETELTLEQIVAMYVRNEPDIEGKRHGGEDDPA